MPSEQLFEIGRRTFDTPGFRGIECIEVEARSVINHVPGRAMPFEWTINPYRGCSHACVYCFARPTHTYLDMDAGRDFETKIVVKVNAPEVLRRELAAPRWKGEHIAMGTGTDPYQRAEGRYRLMRGIIQALIDHRNPFSILTKGTLITRDLDLLTGRERRDRGLGRVLDRHARRGRLAEHRARHAQSPGADRRGPHLDRCRDPDRGADGPGAPRASPTARPAPSGRRGGARGRRDARVADPACTCGPGSARSSCPGSGSTTPTGGAVRAPLPDAVRAAGRPGGAVTPGPVLRRGERVGRPVAPPPGRSATAGSVAALVIHVAGWWRWRHRRAWPR